MRKLATNGNTENGARRCQSETGQESNPVKDWRDGRAVYCTGLENRRSERIRGFESHSLRHVDKCFIYSMLWKVICRVWKRSHNIAHHITLIIVNVGKRISCSLWLSR